METTNGNGKVEHRLTSVEVKLDTILTNHLPHLQKRCDEIDTKMASIQTWLIGLMGGVIVSLVLLIINLFK